MIPSHCLAVRNSHEIRRSIHSIESDYFRSKFEPDLDKFDGTHGIGVISDYDAQPLVIGSHLGTFAVVTVGRINNIEALEKTAFASRRHMSFWYSCRPQISGMTITTGRLPVPFFTAW